MLKAPVVVGLGEILWDILPAGSHLGGAPANFAYIASLLGATSFVVSCVGDDQLGKDTKRLLTSQGLDISALQTDPDHPTGTAQVELAQDGTPRFRISENVAWDHLQWTPELANLAARADIVAFGTLAQRCAPSRETIRRVLQHARPDCLLILDVNIRQPHFSDEALCGSIPLANVLKLNSDELSDVLRSCGLPMVAEWEAARALLLRYSLKAVCITRGEHGSLIVTETGAVSHPGTRVNVVDTVGAGDAFAAALAVNLFLGSPLERTSDAANAMGAWVASHRSAMPTLSNAERANLLSELGML